ncbi:MAG: S-methyl-5-thioribose-1-phosphate isomerase [Gammaproteobacteria bacterium]|jgi:methylthioribose-1-phosphate isomerase|nr:S-methyl-5-thioribose-1-phosphate isomerase [Gammaproteobacteria bacterium]MDP6094435.1 S-methyl-5-thioribose-1-phosphate isomerase [Gammaproteobacteria bacterium]HJO12920.1 S-methyl-5-thioribose-1-phosphate isomerase [Gammaproteobacteria bacterium]
MKIDGSEYRSIWYDSAADTVNIIDQTCLPHEFKIQQLQSLQEACEAITHMQVRGAPLIGVTAVFGLYLALKQDPLALFAAREKLLATRPTAVNLGWALEQASSQIDSVDATDRADRALALACQMADKDVQVCQAIGEHGLGLLRQIWQQKEDKSRPLNVLTHCNAGALATVDWGTALAVIYKAHLADIPLHVWVDETRPRNQGASLTCWELEQQGIPYSLIVDNAGGHLMQIGEVDVCIVGSDRTTARGDVCNKIGTYLKALAANDNGVPFYAAVPISSIDFSLTEGPNEIPIEERHPSEITHISGIDGAGNPSTVRLTTQNAKVSNYGFDITPARLVSGIITEQGVFPASAEGLAGINRDGS